MKNEILNYIKSEVAKGNHPSQTAVGKHFGKTRGYVNGRLKILRKNGLIDWTVEVEISHSGNNMGIARKIFYTFPENNC